VIKYLLEYECLLIILKATANQHFLNNMSSLLIHGQRLYLAFKKTFYEMFFLGYGYEIKYGLHGVSSALVATNCVEISLYQLKYA